ncbi:MAG: 4-hydroxythreonine-4-phosphate dehydrogenase PdxA, partial [Rudaea sp.]
MNDRSFLPRLAITLGEPAGIGSEIVAALAATGIPADLIAIGDKDSLLLAAQTRGLALELEADDGQWRRERAPGSLRYVHVPAPAPVVPGRLDVRNASYVAGMLARAADGCLEGEFDALVTAPVHKGIVNDAGIAFTGHTEFFAERARCDVAMLLVAPGLRVALATTHLPLAEVPGAVTATALVRILRIVYNDLRHRFRIENPRIGVLALNPHAGEGGHLGREEIDVVAPALA